MTEKDSLTKAEDPAQTSGKSPTSNANRTPKLLKVKSKFGKKSSASALKDAKNAEDVMQTRGKKFKKNRKLVLKKQNEINREVHKENQQTEKEKSDVGESSQQKQEENKKNDSKKRSKDQKGKEKHDDVVKKDKDKGELGGIIFFCNAKTKPDCFRYQVMGVSMNKKDLVMAIKSGLKLFLFDYDLKMLYGIFRASSSGGIKLEPKAFDGAFPVQVRFEIYKDCHPLPESVFKKAIEENYNSRHKFDTELSVQQVKRLEKVFRSSNLRSNATVGRSPPIQERVREAAVHANREQYLLVNSGGHGRRYPVQAHESRQHVVYQEVPPLQRDNVSSLFLTEREYRAYGPQGERRNLAALQPVDPALESHRRDAAREHLLRHPDSIHRVPVPAGSESMNPLYLNGREYQTYNLGGRPELSAYLAPIRREDVSSGNAAVGGRDSYMLQSDPLLRINPMDRLYSTYAANLSNRDQLGQHEVPRTDPAATLPVISRYSFPGPSLYR